ncbi:hypothetical protein NADFUDRAFT_47373 [Nadsonia fulvescens var. elongata DSM 6958]|uniref:Cyclin-like domain-containing protein n=1 Tax=Nadsonia fulvescens var. elongata DSM 6958 TaxID=857566 RepID=A0A1E3PHB7_9ASCO|nr:hypothetical protein NADFUDRAFT_47373 [Nadsonia fulvescens var. elongata DSM 6958]
MANILPTNTVQRTAITQSELQSDPYPCLIKLSRPYFTPEILAALHRTTGFRGPYLTHHILQGCNLIWVVGTHFKFPVKTMGTASIIFQRIYLFNAPSQLPLLDTTIACLMIASKIEDTPKKSRELCLTAYNIRSPFNPNTTPIVINPNAAALGSNSTQGPFDAANGANTGNNDDGANGSNSGVNNDPGSQQLEEIRLNVINLERQILESLCFDFRIQHPQRFIIQFAKDLDSPKLVHPQADTSLKTLTKLAWHLSIDTYKTTAPLKHTPNTIAMACLILAYFVLNRTQLSTTTTETRTPNPIKDPNAMVFVKFLISLNENMNKYLTTYARVNAVILDLLDLYIDHANQSHLGLYTPYQLALNDFIHVKIAVNTSFAEVAQQSKDTRGGDGDDDDTVSDTKRAYVDESGADEIVAKYMRVRDPAVSNNGSVRYVLENQVDKLVGESVF